MNKALALIDNARSNFALFAGKTGLKVREHSPEILLVSGVVSIVVGTVLACKATIKAEEILDESEATKKVIEDKHEEYKGTERYTEEDYQHDNLILTGRTFGKLAVSYAPAIACVAGGIAMICASHGIMKRRNAAMMAAYQALNLAYNQYRERVIKEEGELKDRHYLTGAEYEEQIVDEKTGEKKIVEKVDKKPNDNPSLYCKFFDEASRYWRKDAMMNLMFLKCVQSQLNNRLQSRGYVFLNELYRDLDIPETSYGQVVGWIKTEDSFIDLGVYDINDPAKRRFVNGDERNILINPNVQGIIYDLI